jgi:serine protease Do
MEGFENREMRPVQKKTSGTRHFLSTLAGGIIGSVMTLAVIASPYSNAILDKFNIGQESVRPVAKTETSTGTDTVTTPVQTVTTAKPSASSLADMVESASKAIVGVVNLHQANRGFYSPQATVETGTGSGVIFKKTDTSAYIVTNNHVIENASKVEITLADGQKTTAKIIGADALTDLAVLEIEGKYAKSVLNFADSSKVRAGDQVVAIGNPLGLDFAGTVTQGIVSATNRSMPVSTSSGEWELDVIQTDAAINPGNSGGALLNTDGQVIGINSLKISESGIEGLGFAIPSNDVIPIVNELIEKGKITRPYLGVSLADLEQIPAQFIKGLPISVTKGTVITSIDPNSAASKSGLKEQDVIVSFAGEKIESASDLRKVLYTKVKAGDKVKMEVYRNGKLQTVTVTLEN